MVEITRKLTSFEEMDLPKILYKYRDWNDDFHKTILTEQEIYFAKPSSFEDSLDCKIPIRYDLLTDDEIYQKYFAFSVQENPQFTAQQHHEHAKMMQSKGLMRDIDRIRVYQEQDIIDNDKRYGIFSMTAINNNLSMWEKYAACHKGFCVGFKTIPLFEYLMQLGCGGGEVNYFPEIPIIGALEPVDVQGFKQLKFKLDKWEFENEYRLFHLNIHDRIFKIPINIFSEIILGANMSEESKKEIRLIVEMLLPEVIIFKEAIKDGNHIEIKN